MFRFVVKETWVRFSRCISLKTYVYIYNTLQNWADKPSDLSVYTLDWSVYTLVWSVYTLHLSVYTQTGSVHNLPKNFKESTKKSSVYTLLRSVYTQGAAYIRSSAAYIRSKYCHFAHFDCLSLDFRAMPAYFQPYLQDQGDELLYSATTWCFHHDSNDS